MKKQPNTRSRHTRPLAIFALAAAATALALYGCVELEQLDENVCGNRVVEEDFDEDCDGDEGGGKYVCGKAGTPNACRFLCSDGKECPTGYGCGADAVCRRPKGEFEPLVTETTATALDFTAGDTNADGCSEMVITSVHGTLITGFDSRHEGLCAAWSQAIPGRHGSMEEPLTGSPLITELSGNTRPELVLSGSGPLSDGLSVSSSDATGSSTLVSLLYPTEVLDHQGVRMLKVKVPNQGMGGVGGMVENTRDAVLLFLGEALEEPGPASPKCELPDGGTTMSDGGMMMPPDGGMPPPDGGMMMPPDGGMPPPDGGMMMPPDGGMMPPDGGMPPPDGGMMMPPDGGTPPPDGGMPPLDGGCPPPPDGGMPPPPLPDGGCPPPPDGGPPPPPGPAPEKPTTVRVALVDRPEMKAIELEAALAGGGLNSIVALAAADLDGDDCDEVLVGRGGASQIEVYRLCALGGGMTPQYVFEPLSPVTLDNGAKLRYRNASIVVLDLDADQDPKHNLDVVVNATDCQVHAAFGDGTGAFSSPENGAQTTSAIPSDGDQEMYRGLIDTDGVIMAADIRTDRPGLELMHVGCPPGDPFVSDLCAPVARGCEALAADLDGDGLADIVTTQGQQVGLVVGRASTTGGFHFGALDTECPPHDLAVGDFDDDGINDVAFLDQAATASGATTAVKIAYGRPSANPEQPRVAGLLDRAMGLVSGRFTRVAMSDVTAPTKLFAARNLGAGDNVSSAIGMLGGNNERQTLAPFYLPETSAGDANRLADMEIFATAEGKFVLGDDGLPARAMAVIARESGQPMELWLVRHDSADGTLVAVRSEGVTDLACALPEESSAPPGGCVLASANADGDGLDELLLFQDKKLIVLSAGKTGFTELSRAPTTHTFLSIDGVKLPGRYNPRPLVTDLDGSNASVFLRDSEGVIVAFWGNGDGTFEEIELFESGTCSGKCAVARIREGVGAKKRIVLAGPGVLGVYEMSARKPVLLTDVDLPVPTPKKDTDFVAVAARDFDGDGVDDVAIMPSSSSIHVFRGIPVHE